jgi:PAS domain S-box-containing protein
MPDLNMLPKLSDSDSRISKLELENSRLRSEVERLAGFIMPEGMDAAVNLVTVDRRLRQRGAALLSILDNLPAMIGYWDMNLHNRFANQAYTKRFGISPSQLLGMHIRDAIGEERYRLNLPYIQGALKGKPQQFERTIPTPDGKGLRHAQAEYIPHIVEGEVQGFFVQVSDITKIKEAEENSALLKFAFNQVREAFFMLDESGRFFYVNNEACVSLGHEHSKLIGMSVADIAPDWPAETWPEKWNHIKSEGAVTFESHHKMKNGSIFPVEINANYFEFSGKPHVLALARNITERKSAKNALLLQSEILKNVHEGVQMTRANDETIVYATPVFNRMFGYAENELVGQKVSILNASTERRPEQIADEIDHILNESGYWQGEIKNIKKDGSTFWCWVKISSFEHHEFGKVWVAVHEDITLRRQIEIDLEKAKVLMHRDLLVREVHHRVKNNLQGITGVLRLFAANNPGLAKPLDQAISQVQSIAVIHGLQGQTGQNTVHLCEMTSAIAAGIESLWNRPIAVDIPSNWTPRNVVESEAVPMALIINELVANAVKHGEEDRDVTIKLSYVPSSDSVIVSINNYGSIPPGFGLNNLDLFGTGLQLVTSLLPQNGIKLYWSQQGEKVATVLEVTCPIISLTKTSK